ncbi:MAG: DUF4256 domain-containing protein [Acidobacteria bacterium]|nr:DUF4256 domain-containing protein [Acidobacteriota bacterium]MBI3489853.1 DUF4256 domain-containing protein [Acidobacteriota bacterium]
METEAKSELIRTLRSRFEMNTGRHMGIEWGAVLAKLEANPQKLETLFDMERTGGEPDVIGYDGNKDCFTYCDCSPESPRGRRSLCYDLAALDSRKENKPRGNAVEMASVLGIEMLTEAQYRNLQQLGEFDVKTSSWVMTPPGIRNLGGALFCDRRYGQVFVYHNGADSYYAARGFRGLISV